MIRRAFALVVLAALLAACGDGLLEVDRPLLLGNINGQPLPWVPPQTPAPPAGPLAITEGWITIHNGGIAERHERLERWIVNGVDSTLLLSDWTQGGPYRWLPGRIVITYPFWSMGSPGPYYPVETLYVSDRGLTLRETGFAPPLDSVIRVYCAGPPC